jgi:hypothetical protein
MNESELTSDLIRQYLDRIAWRRQAKIDFPGVEFDEKFPESWITAFVVSGKSYFDRDILTSRRRELVSFQPFQSFHDGQVQFLHKRVPGRRYLIGADTAQGESISENETDNCAACVLDLESAEEVGSYCACVRPEEFAWDLNDIGRYYNDAPIMVERNGQGGTTILTLAGECRYTGVMKSKEWLKRERKLVEFDGFQTNVRTRPVALNFLNRWVKETPQLIWDMSFIDEALVFVRNEKGIPKATPGAHDDRVMCRAMAHAARAMMMAYWPMQGREAYLDATRL